MTEINSKPFAEQEGNQGNVGKHKPNENKKSYIAVIRNNAGGHNYPVISDFC